MITRVLIACGVLPTQARIFSGPLEDAMDRFEMDSDLQRAAFLAQCMHESLCFTKLEEGLWFSTPESITVAFLRLGGMPADELAHLCRNPHALADAAYSGLRGNGGQLSDDGWNYRGSGLLPLNGRRNFMHAEMDTGRPYVEQPCLVRQCPADAALTAGLLWNWYACNQIILEHDFDGVSKAINLGDRKSAGTPSGIQARRDLYDCVLASLHAAG